MAQKGINYAISEAKDEMLQTINGLIQRGIPIVAVEMMLINLSSSVSDMAKKVVASEQDRYYAELEAERSDEENAV